MDTGAIVLLIPIVAIVMGGLVRIANIRAQGRGLTDTGDLSPRLMALEDEVTALRRELTETQERLDFTERLLAQHQEPKRLDRRD